MHVAQSTKTANDVCVSAKAVHVARLTQATITYMVVRVGKIGARGSINEDGNYGACFSKFSACCSFHNDNNYVH